MGGKEIRFWGRGEVAGKGGRVMVTREAGTGGGSDGDREAEVVVVMSRLLVVAGGVVRCMWMGQVVVE